MAASNDRCHHCSVLSGCATISGVTCTFQLYVPLASFEQAEGVAGRETVKAGQQQQVQVEEVPVNLPPAAAEILIAPTQRIVNIY